MFAACRTFHPAGPPLEPQSGRLHNLLRSARMNRRLQMNFKTLGNRESNAAPRQMRSIPIGEDIAHLPRMQAGISATRKNVEAKAATYP